MAQYSKSRDSKQKPQKNDDIYEVNLLAHSDGEFVTTVNPWGNQVVLVDDDTVQHTSKNRRKVSTYEVTDYNTFTYGKDIDDWDDLISGTASSIHEPYLGMVRLQVGGTAGDSIIRQSRRVQRYFPGRQNEISMATLLVDNAQSSIVPGITRRVGAFDNENGVYMEHDGTDYNCVIRRNTAGGVVERRIPRADWSDDKLDGTGPSGILLDNQTVQLMVIEYEWYGTGQVEWKFVINNNAISVHKEEHSNLYDYTWSSRATFPIRVEITNVDGISGTHSMFQGSHAFITEGTTELLGRQQSISNALTGKTLPLANTFYPIIALRLKTTTLNAVVLPDEYTAATLDNTNLFVRVIEDATVTGGTWLTPDAESPIEYNLTATSFTGGVNVSTHLLSAGNMGSKYSFPERVITQLKRNTTTTLGDTPSIFLIAVAATNANKAGWGSLGWIEVR